MRIDRYTKTMLTLIVIFLGIIAMRPLLSPIPAVAQQKPSYSQNTRFMKFDNDDFELFDPSTGDLWEYDSLGRPIAHKKIIELGKPIQNMMYQR